MKLLLFVLALTLAGNSCQSRQQTPIAVRRAATAAGVRQFGQPLTADKALAAQQLSRAMTGHDSLPVKVQGVVQAVCQAKGCWMEVKLADNTNMKVRFRDYGFFVPKDIAGKTVVVTGTAYQENVSVADQQHYLKDAGKAEVEIRAVTQPKQEITFVADGVLVQ